MAARQTGKAAFERQQRVSAILTKRIGGESLRAIGEAEGVTPQAIHQMIKRVLASRVTETVEQARSLELMRCDQLLKAVWQRALDGDIACVDRCLQIMRRRSALLGLDLQPSGVMRFNDQAPVEEFDENGRRIVKIEIVNDPEIARREWLFQKRIVALGGNPNIDDENDTPSVN